MGSSRDSWRALRGTRTRGPEPPAPGEPLHRQLPNTLEESRFAPYPPNANPLNQKRRLRRPQVPLRCVRAWAEPGGDAPTLPAAGPAPTPGAAGAGPAPALPAAGGVPVPPHLLPSEAIICRCRLPGDRVRSSNTITWHPATHREGASRRPAEAQARRPHGTRGVICSRSPAPLTAPSPVRGAPSRPVQRGHAGEARRLACLWGLRHTGRFGPLVPACPLQRAPWVWAPSEAHEGRGQRPTAHGAGPGFRVPRGCPRVGMVGSPGPRGAPVGTYEHTHSLGLCGHPI